MDSQRQHPQYLSQQDLAKRWGRTECAIGLASALGSGPRYVKIDGMLHYPFDAVRQYEQDRLLLEAQDLDEMHTLN
jgi:hypothetical protein